MKISVVRGRPADRATEALVISHFEDSETPEGAARGLNDGIRGAIRDILHSGDFKGKADQTAVLYLGQSGPVKRVVLTGLGPRKKFDLERLRASYARAARFVRDLGLKELTIFMEADISGPTLGQMVEAALEAILLGTYQFTPYRTRDLDQIKAIAHVTVVDDRAGALKEIRAAARNADIIGRAVRFARDLVSAPGNEMTPSAMARAARTMARSRRIRARVLDAARMKTLGMNALLGVARGSHEAPRFIILQYRGTKDPAPPVVLVGKGLTFDSGGISIKPAENMGDMKSDMAGGAAVMGIIMASADLKLPVHLVGLVPATENLPGGAAYKPGDVLRSLSGQTIEVVNTDAEGRLILADALTYAQRLKPAAVVDLATLTGACRIALGDHVIGMLGNDAALKEKIRQAGEQTGERVWELPLWEQYDELLTSDVADFKNAGGRSAGAITAAAFLSKFVGAYPWVHLDIAGPAWLGKDRPYTPKGASGIGVRLMLQCLRNWKKNASAA